MCLLSAIPFEAKEESMRTFLPRTQEHSQWSSETWHGELHQLTQRALLCYCKLVRNFHSHSPRKMTLQTKVGAYWRSSKMRFPFQLRVLPLVSTSPRLSGLCAHRVPWSLLPSTHVKAVSKSFWSTSCNIFHMCSPFSFPVSLAGPGPVMVHVAEPLAGLPSPDSSI